VGASGAIVRALNETAETKKNKHCEFAVHRTNTSVVDPYEHERHRRIFGWVVRSRTKPSPVLCGDGYEKPKAAGAV
jgi:hypothetical protein